MDERTLTRLAPGHSDRFFRRLVLTAKEYAMILMDPEGRITGWNDGAERLFGWSADEVLGESGAIIFTEEDRAAGAPEEELEGAAAEGRADDTRWHVKKSGEFFWASAAAEAVYDEQGNVDAFVKVVRDRTDIKRYQEQLEESVRDLDAFASHFAHEVRSPLSGVHMVLSATRRRYDEALEADDAEGIREAEKAIVEIERLMVDLLSFARLGSSDDMERTRVESREAAEDALRLLESTVKERGAEIEVGELPTVYADPTLLRHLFRNLIANAIQHNESEVPRVRVTADEEPDAWGFRVEDNGVGIAEEKREGLFDLFSRGEAGRAESIGVGLALSKRIVERHGGRIWVESEPGRGSTFFFTLPKETTLSD